MPVMLKIETNIQRTIQEGGTTIAEPVAQVHTSSAEDPSDVQPNADYACGYHTLFVLSITIIESGTLKSSNKLG